MWKILCLLALSASLPLTLAAPARAGFVTPAGLNPGDQFFVIFATSTTTPATSPVIATYDAFVTVAASGITYGGANPTWRVYGRTAADDNILSFFIGSALPVYLLNDVLIGASATTFAGSGPTPTPFLTIEENGSTVTPVGTQIWVGKTFGNQLGTFAPEYGVATNPLVLWYDTNTQFNTVSLGLYGFAKLTVRQIAPADIHDQRVGGNCEIVNRFRRASSGIHDLRRPRVGAARRNRA